MPSLGWGKGGSSKGSSGSGGSSSGGARMGLGNISGNTGYDVVQLDKGGPFQVVQPQAVPTSRTASSRRDLTRSENEREVKRSTIRDDSRRNTRTVTDRMDPATRAAYTDLLKQLESGGTDAQKQGMAALSALLTRSEEQEEEFTADAARAQARESLPLYARRFREEAMPTITGAQEAAGLSGDAVSAMLMQDQATRLAEQAAATELQAIIDFAALSQDQQGITADTATALAADPVQSALQDLLEIGKGSYEDTRTEEVINRIIRENSVTNTSRNIRETETENLREDTEYETYGGGQGGSGSGNGFKGMTAGANRDEKMAMLMASLGPFQNLSDARSATRNMGPGPNAEATRASGEAIRDLARIIGVQL